MLGYMVDTVRASRQFRWPSYDENCWREAAATGQTDWSKIDPSLYAHCFTGWAHFTGWARNTGWCDICMTLDHDAADCPYNQGGEASSTGMKWPQMMQGGQLTPFRKSNSRAGNHADAICFKYNKYGGDCMFGSWCHFKHICSVCAKEGLHMEHPKSWCPKGLQESTPSKSMGPSTSTVEPL